MKNLLKIILLASLISYPAQQVFNEEIKSAQITYKSLPKEYKEYKKGKIVKQGDTGIYTYTEYDINGDGKTDVIEISSEEKPRAYGFDLNKNGAIEKNEILIDDEMDGLNGNERQIFSEKK